MSATNAQDHDSNTWGHKENGTAAIDHAPAGAQNHQRQPYNYGGNPLAHVNTGESARLPAFGGDFQPGLYRPSPERKTANPAPLGLCGFALTTFLLSLINLNTKGIVGPNLIVGAAFAYGGLCQLLAGMWEMAIGNTFGATALTSYGGFWIGTAIILTPGGFEISSSLSGPGNQFAYSFGLYLFGWFIFTFLLLICTLRSTVAFFLLFFTLALTFLFLAIGYMFPDAKGAPKTIFIHTGGGFGLLAAFLAWYNALAGIADKSNSFFVVPVMHFPWSEKGREQRVKKSEENTV